MEKILAGFWRDLDAHIRKAGGYFLLLGLLWGFISSGLYFFEGSRSYFEIKAVWQFKIILVAVAFLGRYLLFSRYRDLKLMKWLFIVLFLVFTVMVCTIKSYWFYRLLKVADALAWVLLITVCAETIGALFYSWINLKISIAELPGLWNRLWQELTALGIFLTLLAGLAYYYLISFYLVDSLAYSYLLAVLVALTGAGLFLMMFSKVNAFLRRKLIDLDRELYPYMEWDLVSEDPGLARKLLALEYLVLIRETVVKMCRPSIPLKVVGGYAACVGFILYLPYLFGLVIEVGSFK